MLTSIALLLLTIATLAIDALPISGNSQTVFYKEKASLYDTNNAEDWFMSQEYDMFSSITDYYENMVDTTLSSESEELLLNLIYLPQSKKVNLLQSQATYLGIDTLSDKQLNKMPSIIGKHVQAMNTKVYESIENIITLYWHTIWDPKLLTKHTNTDNQEEHILSFLSSFNGIIAKNLMNEIEEYELLLKIKSDVLDLSDTIEQQEEEQESLFVFDWFKSTFNTLFSSAKTTRVELEDDFLRQHLTDIRTSLLMELHIQFMDFFTRIQTDIVEQLSAYYNE